VVQTSKRKGKDVHNLASHHEGSWWSKGTHTSTTALKGKKLSASCITTPTPSCLLIFGQSFPDAYNIAGWVDLKIRLVHSR